MWLLNVKTRQLEDFVGTPPQYAILSHRWQDGEVTFKDVTSGHPITKKGYTKIDGFCRLIELGGNLQYVWIDTCCIDKSNNAELSEAINSMFQWYSKATGCYVYLADVNASDRAHFEESAWFTRGWTLQELLAPTTVLFFDKYWHFLGNQADCASEVAKAAGIPSSVLASREPFNPRDFCVAERMSWASKRQTTRVEDIAYCLLGLFEVNMPLIYGEGMYAFHRLQVEILQRYNDPSILAWEGEPSSKSSQLASEPSCFKRFSGETRCFMMDMSPYLSPGDYHSLRNPQGNTISGAGISMNLVLKPFVLHTYLVPVCRLGKNNRHEGLLNIVLQRNRHDGCFRRVTLNSNYLVEDDVFESSMIRWYTVVLGNFTPTFAGDSRYMWRSGRNNLPLTTTSYTLTIENINQNIFNLKNNLRKDNVTLMSRFDADTGTSTFRMEVGARGVVGMVKFKIYDKSSFYLIFGHDFDWNIFCLTLRSDKLQGVVESHLRETFSCPRIREHPFLVTSSDDMMELLASMRNMEILSLPEHELERHEMLWSAEHVRVFPVQHGMQVTMVDNFARSIYVRIDSMHRLRQNFQSRDPDQWHVRQWQFGGNENTSDDVSIPRIAVNDSFL